ncbi:MAG: tetratricopeptide repeat protein [Candidatus Poribacteria bacterium]|nr:tetratricopeptide repeat protein [Candidatus Poribacteria bacterium]
MLSFEQLIQNVTDTTQPSIVRSSAIASLVAQGNSQGISPLIECLADSDSVIRREAAKALAQLDATRAAEPLLEALQVESNDLTLWAMLETIGELATPDALPLLESFPTAGSILTRIEVKKSIARIQTRYADGSTSASPETFEPEPRNEQMDANEPSPTTSFGDSQVAPEAEVIELGSDPSPAHSTQRFQTEASDDPLTEHGEDAATDEVSAAKSGEAEPDLYEETVAAPEEITEATNYTQFTEEPTEVMDEAESVEEVTDNTDPAHPEEPTEQVATDTESAQREKADKQIDDLAESIAQSTRLAGSSVNLPVLAPNADTVPYHPKGTALEEPPRENFLLTLIHPGRYLSKQWLYRTRVYLLLWAALIIATIGFIQYQKYSSVELSPLSRIGLSEGELPELVKRSLAEGDFYIQEGFYRKAINSYELSKNLGILPTNSYRKLGFAYFKEGQYALAAEAYETFLEAREDDNPDVFAAEASLVGVYPLTSIAEGTTRDYETYNILGIAYMKLGRVLEAQRAYEQAIRLAPKYGEAYNNLARLYADNYPHVLAANSKILPLSSIGSVLQTAPKLRLAEALAYIAVTLNPDVAAYHNTLGWVLSRRGQVNKAMKTLERAIDLQSDAVELHYHLAQVALKANERKKAVKAIRNVFKLNPAFVPLNAGQ